MVESLTIYVGNLNFKTTNQDFEQTFAKFGEIASARIITTVYRQQRISRGFGFVDFKDNAGYNAAISCQEPVELDGRKIRIVAAKPKVVHPKDTIFLGNIEDATEQDIKDAFSGYNIVEIRIPQPRNDTQNPRHFAFVKFDTEEAQKAASEPKVITIKGKEIAIKLAHPQTRRPGRFGRRTFRGGRRAPKSTTTAPPPPPQ